MDKIKLKSLLIPVDISLKQAMQKLNETAEKILFVVDDNSILLGTVTDGDIRRGIINGLGFFDIVEKVMSREFVSVSDSETDLKELVKQVMIGKKLEQIPVLDDEGIIKDVFLWVDIFGENRQSRPGQFFENQVVIMAGGKGTRLDPFTKILPKPLIPIGNKPVIEIIMENFYRYGFHRFIYTLNYRKEYLKLFLKENKFPYVIDWIEEDDFLGTAGGLALLKDKIMDTFFVTNCDSILEVDYTQIINWHKEHGAAMTIIGCNNEIKIPFGVLELSNGKLRKILEKPVHDVIINTGIYVIEPYVISYITEGKPMDMDELVDLIIGKEKVTVYPVYDGWFDVGQWKEYKKAIEKLQ